MSFSRLITSRYSEKKLVGCKKKCPGLSRGEACRGVGQESEAPRVSLHTPAAQSITTIFNNLFTDNGISQPASFPRKLFGYILCI
jgi:hypothetical protein